MEISQFEMESNELDPFSVSQGDFDDMEEKNWQQKLQERKLRFGDRRVEIITAPREGYLESKLNCHQ